MIAGSKNVRTADRILDVAEGLVQMRGFNAFSYADVARSIGIQKASLHHHFATKADLGVALVDRYRRTFIDALSGIEAESENTIERLERYVALYATVLRRGRMCMCGMLASDVATLPKAMSESIARFFAENEAWLTRVLDEGSKRRDVRLDSPPAVVAASFVSSLEGAMLVARVSGHADHFDAVAAHLLNGARPAAPKERRRRA